MNSTHPFLDFIHPDDKKATIEVIEKELKAGKNVYRFINRYRCKDNNYIWIEWSSHNIPEKGISYSVANDITDKKITEQELVISREIAENYSGQLKAALDSMSDAIFISDSKGNFIEFNDAFATFHKFKNKKECLKTLKEYPDFLDVYNPDGTILPFEMWVVNRAIRGDRGIDEEYILKRKDTGETWVGSYNFAPIGKNDDVIIGSVVTACDITEQKNNEKELIKAKEEAEYANRLKTEFLQNMSHEIRTPLNGIMGFSEILNNPSISEEKRKNYTTIIRNSGEQLLRIVDDILEISTLETKQTKLEETEFCLNDFLMELYAVFNLKAEMSDVPLYLDKPLHDKETYIISDKTKLNKILSNLIENAIKYTTHGSIEIGYRLENDLLKLYVKDTGIGIAAENQQKIFERFSQENKGIAETYGGLGLGLSICKENAQLLGGDITLESQKGSGSTFTMTIPYKPADNAPDVSIPDAKHPAANDVKTILVAEDEEMNYLYIEALFEDESELNYNLIHAKNGREALDICMENQDIDVVLMDIKMPVMNGNTATLEIKKRFPDLPVIAQTAYSTDSEKAEAMKHGYNDFMSKPIDKDRLFETINKFLSVK